MNVTNLPTNAALLRLHAAIPAAAVFVELMQAIYSSGHENAYYRATIVINNDAWFGESDSAMGAVDKAIADHAANNAKAKRIEAARAALEAEGYTVEAPPQACNGWNCLAARPDDKDAYGWQDGYCRDCQAEIAAQGAADSDMRRGKEEA